MDAFYYIIMFVELLCEFHEILFLILNLKGVIGTYYVA